MALYLGDKLISSNLAGGDTNPIGSVIAFAGSNAPVGYLMCDGSAVSRETYAALFAVIGTTYGSGDGSTTFNLPDFKEEYKKLLWTNASPTSNFAAQKISLDLSKYAYVGVIWRKSINSGNTMYTRANVGESGIALSPYQVMCWRSFTVSSTGITFDTGKALGTYGATPSNNDGFTLPYKIYGIKETTPIIKATHNVTIQRIGTIGEDEIVEKKTLLWENPNPSNAMGQTTATLSDSINNYDKIEIEFRPLTNVFTNVSRSIYVSEIAMNFANRAVTTLESFIAVRDFTFVTDTSLLFSNGQVQNTYGTNLNFTQQNQFAVPQKIYGIKHI